MTLYVFDFDLTITSKHVNNTIIRNERAKSSLSDEEKLYLLKGIPTIGEPKHWKELFGNIAKQGHHISIASFNNYPEVIPVYLKEVAKLDDQIIQKITVKTPLSKTDLPKNKNGLIGEIMKEKRLGYNEKIILIDDSKPNLEAAKKAGMTTILATKDASHLAAVQKTLGENTLGARANAVNSQQPPPLPPKSKAMDNNANRPSQPPPRKESLANAHSENKELTGGSSNKSFLHNSNYSTTHDPNTGQWQRNKKAPSNRQELVETIYSDPSELDFTKEQFLQKIEDLEKRREELSLEEQKLQAKKQMEMKKKEKEEREEKIRELNKYVSEMSGEAGISAYEELVNKPRSFRLQEENTMLEEMPDRSSSKSTADQSPFKNPQTLIKEKEFKEKEFDLKRTGAIRRKQAASQLSTARQPWKELLDKEIGTYSFAGAFYSPQKPEEEKEEKEEKKQVQSNKLMLK